MVNLSQSHFCPAPNLPVVASHVSQLLMPQQVLLTLLVQRQDVADHLVDVPQRMGEIYQSRPDHADILYVYTVYTVYTSYMQNIF